MRILFKIPRAGPGRRGTSRAVPVPVGAVDRLAVAEAILSEVSGRTQLVVIDHVASCSGMVFPLDRVVGECRRQGIGVLVDGAHAAGLVPVDLDRLGADFWVGNLHKWLCAPKAAAVLYVAPQWRDELRTLAASHRVNDGFRPAFDWTGTRDPSALLAVPAAPALFERAGWPAVRGHNDDLARRGAELVAQHIGTEAPGGDRLTAAMRLIQLPEPLDDARARELEHRLLDRYKVVVPMTFHGEWQWVRISAQLYNSIGDYERLAAALAVLLPG